jgi:hypothetical protein
MKGRVRNLVFDRKEWEHESVQNKMNVGQKEAIEAAVCEQKLWELDLWRRTFMHSSQMIKYPSNCPDIPMSFPSSSPNSFYFASELGEIGSQCLSIVYRPFSIILLATRPSIRPSNRPGHLFALACTCCAIRSAITVDTSRHVLLGSYQFVYKVSPSMGILILSSLRIPLLGA